MIIIKYDERNNFCFKYIKVSAENISNWHASSKRNTNWVAKMEHGKVSEVLSMDSKVDGIQQARTVVKTKENFYKEQSIKVIPLVS